jgi:hypothetical protein
MYRWLANRDELSCGLSLAGAGILLGMSIKTLNNAWDVSFWSLSFGGVTADTIIDSFMNGSTAPDSFKALALAVLTANSPQILFSTLYLMYNRILTSMVAMNEWNRFAYRRSTLRVSCPTRGQSSTYWLHLPYLYSIPLLAATVLMHWFVSQSIFLARIEMFNPDGTPVNPSHGFTPISYAPGYSPKAIIGSIALGSLMILILVGLSFRRYWGGIPLVRNNSLAISAACHPPLDDYDPAHSTLMWGAVSYSDEDSPGHCCLTSKAVTLPIPGMYYAGFSLNLKEK